MTKTSLERSSKTFRYNQTHNQNSQPNTSPAQFGACFQCLNSSLLNTMQYLTLKSLYFMHAPPCTSPTNGSMSTFSLSSLLLKNDPSRIWLYKYPRPSIPAYTYATTSSQKLLFRGALNINEFPTSFCRFHPTFKSHPTSIASCIVPASTPTLGTNATQSQTYQLYFVHHYTFTTGSLCSQLSQPYGSRQCSHLCISFYVYLHPAAEPITPKSISP